MRARTDSAHIAGWKRAHALIGCPHQASGGECVCSSARPDYAGVPPAELGDVWRVPARAGYALTCPKVDCDQGVHWWDHAYDCTNRDPSHPSCWTWTGSIDDGSLTASPSLHVLEERGGCGWHGWLRGGEMVLA